MEEENSQEKQQEFQRMVTELRESQQDVESLQNQIEILSSSINEIENTIETVGSMENVELGTEILVPIGSGTYITAELKDANRLLSDIGAQLVAERKPEEVVKLLKKEKKDFEESLDRAQNRLKELNEKIEDLRPKVQQLMISAQEGS